MYQVNIYIRNISVYGNTGSRSGNILLKINCKVAIQVTHVNSTGEHFSGLVLEFVEDLTNCNLIEDTNHLYMSHSYFGRNNI